MCGGTELAGMGVVAVGSAIQGLTGFGFSLFSAPLLSLLFPAREAIPMLCLFSVFINLTVLIHARQGLHLRWVLPLTIAGLVGVPIGVRLLLIAERDTLEIIIGALAASGALIYLTGAGLRKTRHETLTMIPVGLLSGAMSGSTTMGGPPVVLFLSNQRVGVSQFRATLAFYFLVLNGVGVPAYMTSGLMTGDVWQRSALLAPGVVLGTLVGFWLASKIRPEPFRKAALVLVLVLGLVAVASGLGALS